MKNRLIIGSIAVLMIVPFLSFNYASANSASGTPFEMIWQALEKLTGRVDSHEQRITALEQKLALMENPGTLTVANSNSIPAQNIGVGNDVILGGFEFTAGNEPIKVTELTLTIVSDLNTTTADGLNSVKLVDSNDSTVAGPADLSGDTSQVNFTDPFIVPIGVNNYKVVANLNTNGVWQEDDKIYVQLATPQSAIIAQGAISGQNILVQPNVNINANTQTIKLAKLMITRNTLPAAMNVVPGTQDLGLSGWNFSAANSAEDIRVTAILFAANSSDVDNLTVKVDGVIKTPVMSAPAVGDNQTTTFAFDQPIVIPKGTSKNILLEGDVSFNAVIGTKIQFGLTDSAVKNNNSVIAYGVSNGNRVDINLVAEDGPVMTIVNPDFFRDRAGAIGIQPINPALQITR